MMKKARVHQGGGGEGAEAGTPPAAGPTGGRTRWAPGASPQEREMRPRRGRRRRGGVGRGGGGGGRGGGGPNKRGGGAPPAPPAGVGPHHGTRTTRRCGLLRLPPVSRQRTVNSVSPFGSSSSWPTTPAVQNCVLLAGLTN